MRVGEILLRQGWVAADDLERALSEHRIAGKRVCSLLITRHQLDPDHAARALAEQFGVSAATATHLANRERPLARLLPANLARQHFALPLGRMRGGEIVVCVRDPRPELQAAFERVLNAPVLIVVAAAYSIEPLIDLAYTAGLSDEFGVTFGRPATAPVVNSPPPPTDFATGTMSLREDAIAESIDIDFDSGPNPLELSEFTVVDLDDVGVEKDFSQVNPQSSGSFRTPTLPPANVKKS